MTCKTVGTVFRSTLALQNALGSGLLPLRDLFPHGKARWGTWNLAVGMTKPVPLCILSRARIWGRCRKCTNQSSEIHSVISQDPTFETASLRPPGAFCILVGSWIALQAVRFALAQFCRTPTVWWRLFWVHLTFMFFKSRRCPWPCKLGPIWPCRLGPTAPIWNSESGSVFGIFQ